VTIGARSLASKPATVDFIGPAAIPQAALTSWQALFDHGHLESGQTVVLHGPVATAQQRAGSAVLASILVCRHVLDERARAVVLRTAGASG